MDEVEATLHRKASKELNRSIRQEKKLLANCPADHPHLARYLSLLSHSLWTRYDIAGARDDLEKSIRLSTSALALHPTGHPDRAKSLHALAVGLSTRYDVAGTRDDLDKSIRLDTEALALRPPGHPNRADSLYSLAIGLTTRYDVASARDDLDDGMRLNMEALDLCPPGHPDRPDCLHSFARLLLTRYVIESAQDDLDRSICMNTEALSLRPPGHPERAFFLQALSVCLSTRYHNTGSRDDLDQSIGLDTDALLLCPPGHPNRVEFLRALAIGLRHRYYMAGARDDLDKSICLSAEALTLCPPGHPNLAAYLDSYSYGLWTRYNITGARDDLDQSIRLDAEALALRPPGHSERAKFLDSCSHGLFTRFDIAGARDDLDQSIHLDTEALALRPRGHPDRAASLHSLCTSLSIRFDIASVQDDLDRSILLGTEALSLRSPGHPQRAVSLHSLGTSLLARYKHAGAQDDMDKSILLHTEALTLTPPDNPARASSLAALAIGLSTRYDIGGAGDDLDQSIRLRTEALTINPAGHPNHARSLRGLAVALLCTQPSTSRDDRVFRLLKEGSTDVISPLTDSLLCMRMWVKWASESRHDSLTEAFDHVIPFLRRYLTIGPTVTHQFDALKNTVNLPFAPLNAASHWIKSGNVEKAVEMLDEGRSLLWSEMRRFRVPLLNPSLVGEELAGEFETTRSDLQRLSTIEATYDAGSTAGRSRVADSPQPTASISFNEIVSQKPKLLKKYEEILARVRVKPGFEDFLKSLPFGKLQEAAKEGPVVIVNCSKFGSHVIIVFVNKPPDVIHLEDSFAEEAVALLDEYHDALQSAKGAHDASKTLHDRLTPLMCLLWDLVVSKVVQQLEESGVPHGSRIWWCPTSVLTGLPFHAAGTTDHGLVDKYVSSYTPTLKALIDARQQASLSPPSRGPYPRILVVAPPDTRLQYAKDELSVMRHLGSFVESLDSSATNTSATRDSVLQQLPSYDWAHLICHGTLSDSGNAFDSALILRGGERLTLRDIVKAHLPDAKFAFLAACHSAEQGRDDSVLQDEVLHLASAMHFSGFRSVIGTLWEMEDKDGPKVAQLLYEKMLEGEDDPRQRHTRAARALWEVTRRMKEKGLPLDRWANFVHIGA